MNADFRYGFRVLGDCRKPRRLVNWQAAFRGYAACDPRAECNKEGYLSAFCFGGDFRDHLAATGSTAGFSGPCWAPFVWWDVDREGDLPAALDDARRLCAALTDSLGIAEDDVLAFLSGGKGFHLGVPSAAWQPAPGRDFHRIARRFAEAVAEPAGVTIDAGVYDRVRCFRAPNSRHPKTGLHKRRLSVDELMHLGTGAILTLAVEPADFELPAPTYRSEPAAALWAEAAAQVQRETDARAGRLESGDAPNKLNRATLDFIREGASVGDRHRRCYSAAANLAELGAPLALCAALLTEAGLDCGLTPTDTRRAIENGWASAQPGIRDVCGASGGEVIAVQPAPAGASANAGKGGAP
ncbi:MAG: DNA primase [Phycisphaerae bacterium]|nr:DNA primase [Phycisphaerae bacterium]MCZ2401406.1 DNA primase [Phycisphaerae bacterium]